MQNRRQSLIALSLLIFLGLIWAPSETRAQIYQNPSGDFTWGQMGTTRESLNLNREDVIAREGSCPTGGCVLKLDRVEVNPYRSHPGDTVTLTTVYTILTPEQLPLPVSISREILYQDRSLGKTKSFDDNRLNGSWTQKIDFKLPDDARPGVYTLRTKVTTGYESREKDTTFLVY